MNVPITDEKGERKEEGCELQDRKGKGEVIPVCVRVRFARAHYSPTQPSKRPVPASRQEPHPNQNANPCSINLSISPPAAATAFIAASLILLLFSTASFSRLAFVLLLPLGATPVINTPPSFGVKLTKPTPRPPPPPPPPAPAAAAEAPPPLLTSRDRRFLTTLHGVPGRADGWVPEALRTEEMDPPDECRELRRVGDADGARVLRMGDVDMCLAPELFARGGLFGRGSDAGVGGGR